MVVNLDDEGGQLMLSRENVMREALSEMENQRKKPKRRKKRRDRRSGECDCGTAGPPSKLLFSGMRQAFASQRNRRRGFPRP